jgi:pimeloyl-ACP methyl ester carboxylesterase
MSPSVRPVAEFCTGMEVPSEAEQRPVPVVEGTELNSVWLGAGGTTAVLLHQTDGNGLCGFLFFADYLAGRGIRVAAVDLCGYGQSACLASPAATDRVAQVGAVVKAARAEGAKRVVLVGASMGGSIAITAAGGTGADAVVDLSGPASFESSDINRDAGSVSMPALFAFSKSDSADLAAVRAALPRMPTKHKIFLTFDIGHGYELLQDLIDDELTPLAPKVAAFVAGRTP